MATGLHAPLTAESIRATLTTHWLGHTLTLLQDATSTNELALAAAQSGSPDGTVIVADRQTAGRGRLARTWESPAARNLYVSILIRRLPSDERLGWLPLLAGTAAAAAIHILTPLSPSLKWPNDLLVGSKKVGGILSESQGIGTDNACAVLGIGLNVNWLPEEMPTELKPIATSLAAEMQTPVDRARLLARLLIELEQRVDQWRRGDLAGLATEYRTHCGTIGQQVRIDVGGGGQLEGTVTGIEPDGSLRLHSGSGRFAQDRIVHTGDVMHLRPA